MEDIKGLGIVLSPIKCISRSRQISSSTSIEIHCTTEIHTTYIQKYIVLLKSIQRIYRNSLDIAKGYYGI